MSGRSPTTRGSSLGGTAASSCRRLLAARLETGGRSRLRRRLDASPKSCELQCARALGVDSGFDLARQLADGRGPATSEVILVSTHPEDDFADLVAESPAIGFIPKSDLSRRAIEDLLRRFDPAGGNDRAQASRTLPRVSDATIVEAGGRDLRVSSPDRVIFPATERSAAVTKLEVVNYYLAVGEGIMRALERRPTTLERWPKGVHPGIVLSTREKGGGDAFFQKRIPRGAPDYVRTARIEFPSGRHADEICPTEVAVVGWAAQMGTITFHPWPVRSSDVDHPDELRLDLDPQPGTDFDDAVRVAATARELLGDLGYTGFPKTSGGRGVHIYVRIERNWSFTDVRHAAIAFGRELERRLPGEVTTKWWKEERGERIFVDYNQNARDRTIASAYSIRPKPGAPVSAPVTWDELDEIAPEDFTVATMPARFAEVGDRHAAIDDKSHSLQPLLDMYEADEEGDMPYPPDYPKMPGEPKRVQPSRDTDRER